YRKSDHWQDRDSRQTRSNPDACTLCTRVSPNAFTRRAHASKSFGLERHQRRSVSNTLFCASDARAHGVSRVALSLCKYGAAYSCARLHGARNRGRERRLRNTSPQYTTTDRISSAFAQTESGLWTIHQQEPLRVLDGDGLRSRSWHHSRRRCKKRSTD